MAFPKRAIIIYLVGVGVFGVYWMQGKSAGELDTPVAVDPIADESEASGSEASGELPQPALEGVDERVDSRIEVQGDEVIVSERAERYAGEAELRDILTQLKEGSLSGEMSDVAYQAYLSDLEEWFAADPERFANVWQTIQAEFGTYFMNSLEDPSKGVTLKADVERKFGFAWGQADPERSLNFARQAGDHVLAGWVAGQIDAENDYPAMLEAARMTPSPEVYWEALVDIAKSDTILSLDTIVAYHMEQMGLDKWKEILFSPGNSDDAVLASWFQKNIGHLNGHENFDEIEVVRMLRRFDYGEGSFMLTSDLARVDAAKAAGDYAATARILEELSALYGDAIDASAAGRFAVKWSKQDFAAASDWLLANSDKFIDQESFVSMLGTSYRHEAGRNAERALQHGLAIEDESYQAMVFSTY